MDTFITMSFPSEIRYARLASNAASMVAEIFSRQVGIWEKRQEFCHAFELSVAEAFSNSVRNAANPETDGQIIICFSSDQNELMVSVRDTNPAFDPDIPAPDILSYPDRGYGLLLIRQLMDQVLYSRENDMNLLSMIKKAG